MNDDIERRLRRVLPLSAPVELRARVLLAVADELQRGSPPLPFRRSFRPAAIAAAALGASFVLNLLINDRIDRRLTAAFGPPPISMGDVDIAAVRAKEPDRSERQRASGHLAVRGVSHDTGREYVVRLQHMIEQLTIDFKESADEAPRKNSQMDRDRRGSRDRRRSRDQRDLDLDHGITA